MNFRKIAIITILVFSSFAANSVAPSKTELEAMYDKAFREFSVGNYPQALKELDAIDARQPDLAESHNLRGVILMRQADYDKAETALQKAVASDPKFWNARFNLAEIPFLRKDWAEARNRFQALLSGSSSELQGEASQLIQYKILLTFLLEGKESMVDSILAKFELSPDTPAVHYANAAIALHNKKEQEAKDWLTAAEKNFSAQLNKLFAESLYEVGWMEKPAGQTRAAIELNSAAERLAKAKALANSKFEQAEQAFQQRDLTAARKLADEADAADPNQARVLNLRGQILLEQKEFDQAEEEFRKAAKADPKFREATFNLAQIPFKKKEYSKARDRFEALFSTTSGADKDQAAQLIKFKIYLTLLLEGKDSRAQKMMEQFQFTGDTPALYYAQAAWEFKHNNAAKANDWVTSARKIYSPALNIVFADPFYDLGWLQSPAMTASSAPAVADAAPSAAAPLIEPTPIPSVALAQNTRAAEPAVAASPQVTSTAIPGMEATTSLVAESPASSAPIATVSPSVETPVASTALPEASAPVASTPAESVETSVAATSEPASETAVAPSEVASSATASPATVLAPAQVRESSARRTLGETFQGLSEHRTLIVVGLLVTAVGIIAWVIVPPLRRRVPHVPLYRHAAPVTGPRFGNGNRAEATPQAAPRTRLAGGPPQISLKLKASEPSLRRAVGPVGKPGNGFNGGGAVVAAPAPAVASVVEEVVLGGSEAAAVTETVVAREQFSPAVSSSPAPMVAEPAPLEQAPAVEETFPLPVETEAPALWGGVTATAAEEAFVASAPAESTATFEPALEPVGQGQPIPYQTPAYSVDSPMAEITKPEPEPSHLGEGIAADAAIAGVGALRQSVESPSFAPQVVSTEPLAQQPTTPVTMPQPTQPSPATAIRTAPVTGPMPQPAGGMQTAVQLTFAFEIAALQLTPSFKMGALQLKPTSKIVTMRLAPSQHPQPAMNLQVTFEVAAVQLAGSSIGTVRLTPSQQQRPNVVSSPSFTIAGLQLVTGSENAPLQLTPTAQGQPAVHVTGGFQIATVEFSPAFEIASIVLNSTSKNVSVQLPGSGPSPVEGAPVFEVSNVQLTANGEIGLMHLNPHAAAPKRA